MLRYGYKLRFYQLSGPDKGNLSHEEFFQDREQMMVRYSDGICTRITRLSGNMLITSGRGSLCENAQRKTPVMTGFYPAGHANGGGGVM